jgi:hypothetical protein
LTTTAHRGAIRKSQCHGPDRVERLLWWLTLGYSAFVIYGSLVPLHFQRQPLEAAWAYFQRIPYLDLGIGSRADWVANILLFVTLAFLWLGLLWPRRSRIAQAVASGVVLVGGVGLSGAIEFTQIFFRRAPFRSTTSSPKPRDDHRYRAVVVNRSPRHGLARRVVRGAHADRNDAASSIRLPFLVFGYSVLPLDLTISVVDLPQMAGGQGAAGAVQRPLRLRCPTRVRLARGYRDLIPAAFLWKLSSSHSARKIVQYVLVSATIIEILQFVRLLAGHPPPTYSWRAAVA